MACRLVIRFASRCRSFTSLPVLMKHPEPSPRSQQALRFFAPLKTIENDNTNIKTAKMETLKILEELFNINAYKAFEIIIKNKSLYKVDHDLIRTNFNKYSACGINNETLIKYPELLTESETDKKLLEIEKLYFYNINTLAPLIMMKLKQLKNFLQCELLFETKEMGRIATFANLLKINEERACSFLGKKPFLVNTSLDKLNSIVTLLTNEYGIETEEICNDLWVLGYNYETIKTRLDEARNYKIESVKTWMVRAQPEIFKHYIKRRTDNKSILGDNSLAEYLSKRLECSVEMSNFYIKRHPPLQNKSLKKLKDLIDFLFAEGFQPSHICRVPKILVHSVETTRKRLKQLEEQGIQIDSLHMLTKSQKQFTQYYDNVTKKCDRKK